MKINHNYLKAFALSMGLAAMTLTANNLNAQNGGGLFGRGETFESMESNSRGALNVTGNTESGISNYGIGEEVPVGSGLVILLGACLGYVALKKKEDEQ